MPFMVVSYSREGISYIVLAMALPYLFIFVSLHPKNNVHSI